MFHDARLKIERAYHHIENLKATLAAFLDTDFYRLVIEKNAETGRNLLKFSIMKPIPNETPLIIGDAIHNLRTALDLVAAEIVRDAGGDARHAKFPVRGTQQELIGAINKGTIQLRLGGVDITSLLVVGIRPYRDNRGNIPLCDLHALDNTDKHQLLIRTVAIASIMDFFAEDENQNSVSGPLIVTLGEGDTVELGLLDTPSPMEIKRQGHPTFEVSFGQGQPFEGEAVIPTLHQLAELVAAIVNQFEQTLLARAQGAGHTPPAPGSHPPST